MLRISREKRTNLNLELVCTGQQLPEISLRGLSPPRPPSLPQEGGDFSAEGRTHAAKGRCWGGWGGSRPLLRIIPPPGFLYEHNYIFGPLLYAGFADAVGSNRTSTAKCLGRHYQPTLEKFHTST